MNKVFTYFDSSILTYTKGVEQAKMSLVALSNKLIEFVH